MTATDGLVGALATACTAIALLVLVIGMARLGRRPDRNLHEFVAAIALALELLLAAGLLRLSSTGSWTALATTATIVAVRKLVGFGLAAGTRAVRPGSAPPPRA